MAQLIVSDLFSVRGPLTGDLRNGLACRGSGTQLRDTLVRHGWAEGTRAAAVVAGITPGTGEIRGVRFATVGPAVTGNIKMKHLMANAADLELLVTVPCEKIPWPMEGDRDRNLSDWMKLGDTEAAKGVVRTASDKKVLTGEEMEERGIKTLLVRFSLMVASVERAVLSGHVVHVTDLAELGTLAARWELRAGVNAPNIPTVGVRVAGSATNLEIPLMVKEPAGTGLGFGLLPLLEEIAESHSPVDRDTLEMELRLFLRKVGVPTNVRDWLGAMREGSAPAERTAQVLWPEYPGPTGETPGNQFVPRAIQAGKYGPGGEYTEVVLEGYDIPMELREVLVGSLNASLSKRTWSSYSTAYRSFVKALGEYDIPAPSVITVRHLLIFVGWMLATGKAASTARTYISGVRKVAEARGVKFEEADINLVMAAIKGKANVEVQKPFRQLMTVQMMIALKKKLAGAGGPLWTKHNKRLFWLLAVSLFWSSCRGGELAMETEVEFDPNNNLLWEDVSVEEDGQSVTLTLKAPKEVKGMRVVQVELVQVGGDLCPLDAWRKFRRFNKLGENPGLPVFRWESGRNLTLTKMNSIMKGFLEDVVDYNQGNVGVHCFRNALPSLMRELGYDDEAIKAQGRWSSEAFNKYIKLSRAARREERRKLAGAIHRVVGSLRA